jgi:hypothetical protein
MTVTVYELVSIKRDACHVTKIWRKIFKDDEPEVDPSIPDWSILKRQELAALDQQIEAMLSNPIYRPPWAVGFTTQELIAIVRHEGVNPYRYDWWDRLDPVVIKEARQQRFKRAGLASITELKAKQATLKREIAWMERE